MNNSLKNSEIHITANLHKKQKTVNGFIFKFKNDNLC